MYNVSSLDKASSVFSVLISLDKSNYRTGFYLLAWTKEMKGCKTDAKQAFLLLD